MTRAHVAPVDVRISARRGWRRGRLTGPVAIEQANDEALRQRLVVWGAPSDPDGEPSPAET